MAILENFMALDITDKTLLQSQFNHLRSNCVDCINTMDEISKKISKLKKECMEISTDVYSKGLSSQASNSMLKADEEYQKKLLEIEGYERGMKILEEELNFIKSDIKILLNSMYNKF